MIIKSIHYTRIQDIIQFRPHHDQTVDITTVNWQEVPMHVASGSLTHQSRNAAPGPSITHTITCRLKQSFTTPRTAILKITMCDDKQIIIGTPDLPVQITKNGDLYLDKLTITHESPHKPLTLNAP